MYEEPKPIESEQPVEPVAQQQVVKPAEYEPPVKPAKKSGGKAILLILLVLILMGAAAGGTYWWRDKTANESKANQDVSISTLEKAKIDLQKLLDDEIAKNAGIAPVVCAVGVAPSATVIESIKSSIISGNTAPLEGYMATSVNVILAPAKEIPSTPTAAISSISNFISNDNTSWDYDFALPAATLSSYSSGGYKQYFLANSVVGRATNKKVISFSFDCNAKISTVFLAANEGLLTAQ